MNAPFVGQPASINLFSDRLAAVVVKVNAKSVVVRRVEVGEQKRDERVDQGPFPVLIAEGQVDKPYGAPERYSLVGHRRDGSPVYRNGSIGLSLGVSQQVRDYRY